MGFPNTKYEGIQSLVEYLYFVPSSKGVQSVHDSSRLFLKTPVNNIRKRDDWNLDVTYRTLDNDDGTETFDYALVTTTAAAGEMSMKFEEFSEVELPQQKRTHANSSFL